jgi:competence protein ComEA
MSTAMGKLDINTATQEEIERIHGIGEARARQIVEYREQHGGIRHIDELLELPLFKIASEEDRRLLAESVTVNPETLPVSIGGKLNLNVADRDDLERIRGIGPQRAEIILNHRRRYGHFRSLDEIDTLPSFDLMDKVELEAIKAHLTLE